MESITKYVGKTLTLIQPSLFKKDYVLMNDEEVAAKLNIKDKLKTNAVIEMYNIKWEIKQISFWKSEFGIYKFGNELPFAVLKQKLFGSGLIELPKGVKLNVRFRFWKRIFEITDEYGDVILFSKGRGAFKERYSITINKVPHNLDEYPWLIVVPGFLAVISKNHAAAAS